VYVFVFSDNGEEVTVMDVSCRIKERGLGWVLHVLVHIVRRRRLQSIFVYHFSSVEIITDF
jgi:hypothetical protein